MTDTKKAAMEAAYTKRDYVITSFALFGEVFNLRTVWADAWKAGAEWQRQQGKALTEERVKAIVRQWKIADGETLIDLCRAIEAEVRKS